MMGPNFMDEIDCGSFFDHIDDLIDFPAENEAGFGSGSGSGSGSNTGICNNFPSIWTNGSDGLPGSDPLFTGSNSNSASDLSAELAVPYEDIVQLEWLSTFVEDSFSGGGMTINKDSSSLVNNQLTQHHSQFQTSSPVSVLESSSSSSSSGGKTMPPLSPTHRGTQRARSKRARPPTFKPRPAIHPISPTSSITDNAHLLLGAIVSSDSENFAESNLAKMPKPAGTEHKKKKKVKVSIPSGPEEIIQCAPSQSVRKCMHCEITKTPQWRAGPMGPKTLCNACGVRYKSGRLFPEYRPAASPTFVPSLHSNSHKKVVEMRTKGSGKTVMASAGPVSGCASANSMTTQLEVVPVNEAKADCM